MTILLSLKQHASTIHNKHLRDYFREEPNRFAHFHVKQGDFLFDYSKNRIDHESLNLLEKLMSHQRVSQKRDAMFAGERINNTENRAVFHVGLRDLSRRPLLIDGKDVRVDIEHEREKMLNFATKLRDGLYKGVTGKPFKNIINIGIGGSDLGPAFATKALSPYSAAHINSIFVSNVDPAHVHDSLKGLDASETLIIVASKTFTTQETMMNAKAARAWLVGQLGEAAVFTHFAALSTNIAAVKAFGINEANIFGFWDWVGGRYSLMSAIGLSLAIAIGRDNFMQLLQGAYKGDRHFVEQPFRQNIPMLMAAITYFYRQCYGFNALAVLPYDERLSRFPAYLQQLDMESLGKSVKTDGSRVDVETGSLIWGEAGTNGQHAFYQLLHQGTQIIPCDFLCAAHSHEADDFMDREQHSALVANALAQAESLMMGKSSEEVAAQMKAQSKSENEIEALKNHRRFDGNRPSNFMLYDKLTPETLGFLIAIYEHKVFTIAALCEINAFDQWGVELGKEQASKLLPLINSNAAITGFDSSTTGLLSELRKLTRR